MKIELYQITVRNVFNGYQNNDENGVVGYLVIALAIVAAVCLMLG